MISSTAISMKRPLIILILLLLGIVPLRAQQIPELGDSAFASLLTCGQGDEFYETFGHTAIRICDSVNRIDLVFNYGSFDDFEDNFYLKFARGQMDYCVVAQYFDEFMFEYMYYGRSVWEQQLNLTKEELARLFKALIINIAPENMYYSYDFFRDNCATRVTDIVASTLQNRQFPKPEFPAERTTYRDLVHRYTSQPMPWWELGIDILIGARCDQRLNQSQYMFAPIEMMYQYDTLRFTDDSAVAQSTRQLLFDRRIQKHSGLRPPLVFALLLLVVAILTILAPRKGWSLLWLDYILFAAAGLVSLLLLFLWFGSDHWCTKWNFNLLWANPLFLWLLFRLRKPGKKVLIATLAFLALLLLIWLVGWPQQFSVTIMLIAITLALRITARLKALTIFGS